MGGDSEGGGRGVCGGGHRLFRAEAEINHSAEAIMCNSTPARLVTLVT